jgi:hypothetical protein
LPLFGAPSSGTTRLPARHGYELDWLLKPLKKEIRFFQKFAAGVSLL